MAEKVLVSKGYELMYLSMGALTLLLVVFFSTNSKTTLNTNVDAHKPTSIVGILRKDAKHAYPCNKEAKADYVLQDKTAIGNCVPVVANPSEADSNLDKTVEVSGQASSGVYYATGFKNNTQTIFGTPAGSGSPGYIYHPAKLWSPTPATGSYTGPATRNPY